MTRVLSAFVLLPIVVATIWVLPPLATLALAEVVVLLAFAEYGWPCLAAWREASEGRDGGRGDDHLRGARVGGRRGPRCADGGDDHPRDDRPGMGRRVTEVLHDVSAAVFALLYLGLPLGALVAIRVTGGREALLLLLVCVMMSDTAQYYGGLAFGRRLLAPAISPNKTIEARWPGSWLARW